jgi:uncharacterized membrane protein YbaN (DUF454 family)
LEGSELNRKRKRWLILAAGWGCMLLGIAGLFLPVLQGILFLVIGLVLLSSEYVWAHNLLLKLRTRFPKVAAHVHEASEKARAFVDRTPAD